MLQPLFVPKALIRVPKVEPVDGIPDPEYWLIVVDYGKPITIEQAEEVLFLWYTRGVPFQGNPLKRFPPVKVWAEPLIAEPVEV